MKKEIRPKDAAMRNAYARALGTVFIEKMIQKDTLENVLKARRILNAIIDVVLLLKDLDNEMILIVKSEINNRLDKKQKEIKK